MPKTKADTSFEQKRRAAIQERDWASLATAFTQYGNYLELIGEDKPVGAVRRFQIRRGRPKTRA